MVLPILTLIFSALYVALVVIPAIVGDTDAVRLAELNYKFRTAQITAEEYTELQKLTIKEWQ